MLEDIAHLAHAYIPTVLDYESKIYYYKLYMYFFESKKKEYLFNCRTLRECYVNTINGQRAAVDVCEDDLIFMGHDENERRITSMFATVNPGRGFQVYKFKIYKVKNEPIKLGKSFRLSKDYESVMYTVKVRGTNPNYRFNINDQMFKTNKDCFKEYYDDITSFVTKK